MEEKWKINEEECRRRRLIKQGRIKEGERKSRMGNEKV